MHDDETRPEAFADGILERYFVANPDRLLEAYRDLESRTESPSRTGTRDAARLMREVKTLRATNEALTRKLGSTTASLEASRTEIKRLKSDLAHVRGSRSLRIGRAVLSPLQLLRRRGRSGSAPRVQISSSKSPTLQGPAQSVSLEELRNAFRSDPSPESLTRLVVRQWYQNGFIREPAQLLERHHDLAARLQPRDRRTADRIIGAARVMANPIVIPDRSSGAAYSPEPGRVMYCVHSTPIYSSNGYSTRTRGVARGLADAGRDVVIVARAGYPWDTKSDRQKPAAKRVVRQVDGLPYVHLPGADLNNTPLDHYLQIAADAYVREARLWRPEIIHAASNHLTALPALIAARRLGIPFVYEVRGLWEVTEASTKPGWEDSERYSLAVALETLVAREADGVVAITAEVAQVLVQRGVESRRVSLAPNAVDPQVFLPLPRDKQYAQRRGIRTDVPVIGFAGSIVEYEGLDRLLDASRVLDERGIDHQVVIAGSGAATEALQARRDACGMRSILFLGRLPMDEMPQLMSTFDIMPCPRVSLPVTELVSPLKPLEAFGCGKAVILTDLSPHQTLAGSSRDRALLVPDNDVPALADAMERLIQNADERASLGRSARLWVLDERTWATIGRSITTAYRKAQDVHDSLLPTQSTRLGELRVGIIADEFTTSTLAPTVQLVPLQRAKWREQLAEAHLDLVLVESAWEGNGGQWHRGVGDYSERESADIRDLLGACRDSGIPTVFWNKEDPVHFDRFRATAAACDHVFTTDASMISPYLSTPAIRAITVSSLPFYAQPSIHNPLPSDRSYEPTIAYAGTYYGDRYPDRSRQLEWMLDSAADFGLTIYDRQLGVIDSPYQFPSKFASNVRGVLPYQEVIKSYRTHLAHLNVNSVNDSPTMFSRRVVEVAACGGVVLSGPGRGIEEALGSAIPVVSDPALCRAYLHSWVHNPVERLREAWLQMRAVYRSHTIDTALVLVARTAGIAVEAPRAPRYGALVDGEDDRALESLATQSLRPEAVYVIGPTSKAQARLAPLGVKVIRAEEGTLTEVDWLARWTGDFGRTHAEDLLLATRFGDWSRISYRTVDSTRAEVGTDLVRLISVPFDNSGFVRASLAGRLEGLEEALTLHGVKGIEWVLPPILRGTPPVPIGASTVTERPRTILVAGHDLKFARGLLAHLQERGHVVLVDEWQGHNKHDADRSGELLRKADVVFCEWGLGNLEWYSRHIRPGQRLVTRIHLQEIDLPYLGRTVHDAVDAYLFVGELIRRSAILSHGVPSEKAHVVPNIVDVDGLWRPKKPGAERNLGLVGIVPQRKRLDLALDVLESLLERDPTFRLFIKGALPSDYPWMAQRPNELAWYEAQFDRARRLNSRWPDSVVFDGFGDDMNDWYSKIGIALSVSDFESFHFTIADGAASGALPASLAWDGADLIYPREWLSPTVAHMAARIASTAPDAESLHAEVAARFGARSVLQRLTAALLGG